MTTKITLTIDSRLAKRAQKYALKKNISVDEMIEKQVEELLRRESDEIAPAVKQLAGILKTVKVKNEKKEFREHVLRKHG